MPTTRKHAIRYSPEQPSVQPGEALAQPRHSSGKSQNSPEQRRRQRGRGPGRGQHGMTRVSECEGVSE